mgnify:FL=1
MSDSYLVVELNHQPVELCKLLKIADLVGGGGEAKIVISEGYVLLNGEVEYQKRKKVYHEDVVEFNGEIVQLIINDELNEHLPLSEDEQSFEQPESVLPAKLAEDKKPNKKAPEAEGVPKKRRPISF